MKLLNYLLQYATYCLNLSRTRLEGGKSNSNTKNISRENNETTGSTVILQREVTSEVPQVLGSNYLRYAEVI